MVIISGFFENVARNSSSGDARLSFLEQAKHVSSGADLRESKYVSGSHAKLEHFAARSSF
jgi:hypothetical protein